MVRGVSIVPFRYLVLVFFLIHNLDLSIPQTTEEDTRESTTPAPTTSTENPTEAVTFQVTTEPEPPEETLPELEIVQINVIPSIGNAVKLVWGKRMENYNLNWTYAVYCGLTPDELQEPRVTTSELFAVVNDLEFCKKYLFGVGVVENYARIDPNSSYIRSIITYADRSALPNNVTLDFEPGEVPCLLIKWSASCSSLAQPIGYLITMLEKPSQRLSFIRIPEARKTDLAHSVAVKYGTIYDVKISTSDSGFNTTEIVSFQIPYFLQPYKVRVTINPDETFMMFWREPYVPFYVGEYYYEVYVYKGRNISDEFESYKVDKPVYIHEGEEYVYTFSVGLTAVSGDHRSYLTQPIVADKNGETYALDIYNQEQNKNSR